MAASSSIVLSFTTTTSTGATSRTIGPRAAYDNFHPLDGKFDAMSSFRSRTAQSISRCASLYPRYLADLEMHQRGHRTPDHAGVHRPAKASLFSGADVEGSARFRYASSRHALSRERHHLWAAKSDQPLSGFVGVANVGLDENWLGSPLAMANLYGFGRLAWNPDLTLPSKSSTSGHA